MNDSLEGLIDEVNTKLLQLMLKDPKNIKWKNITDEKIDWFINYCLIKEIYELIPLFESEKNNRKMVENLIK